MADEPELMRLQLAFAYHMIEEVIRSDADLETAEEPDARSSPRARRHEP